MPSNFQEGESQENPANYDVETSNVPMPTDQAKLGLQQRKRKRGPSKKSAKQKVEVHSLNLHSCEQSTVKCTVNAAIEALCM